MLDDIAGLSLRSYREFAHPYLKQICDAFPSGCVKIYHNDANVKPFLSELPDTGFDVLNWTHKLDIRQARAASGGRLCLMGNVLMAGGEGSGLILSVGGGVSPGMPKANILVLTAAALG
ncbi:MAG TPA: uroporphyrinogen decarboxylase family protein [Bryobacteraceae bacterium]|nr:uroporphyrinogen decarboxylase family protein [Bryobacteraceae bacterium]